MPVFYRDENSATRSANFPAGAQCSFDGRAIIRQIDNFRGKKDRIARRSRPQQFDRIFRRNRAWRVILFRALHQMISRRPVAVTIEQRADDAAIQNSRKCFVLFLRLPFCNDFIVFWKTVNTQSFGIRRPATPARIVWSILFLQRFRAHGGSSAPRLILIGGEAARITSRKGLRDPPALFGAYRSWSDRESPGI